jgi:hypothetical protein
LYTGKESFHLGINAKRFAPADPLDPLIKTLEDEIEKGLSFTRNWFDSFYSHNEGSNVKKYAGLKKELEDARDQFAELKNAVSNWGSKHNG